MHVHKERAPWTALALFAGIVAVLLMLVTVGSRSYAAAEASQSKTRAQRTALSYVFSRVRAADMQNGVALANGAEGAALILRDFTQTGVYETRIYLYQGNLVEEYAAESAPYAPENALVIAPASSFSVTLKDGFLTAETEQGRVCAALRAGGNP